MVRLVWANEALEAYGFRPTDMSIADRSVWGRVSGTVKGKRLITVRQIVSMGSWLDLALQC